mgnify:CR=1 FL=1
MGTFSEIAETILQIAARDNEITRLRAELAKVTWQRNEAQAGLAASRAELAHYVNRFGLWGAPLPRASLSTIHTLADQPGLDGESPA